MIKVLIVEDELNIQQLLIAILTRHFPEVEVIGKAQSVPKAIELIGDFNPDLVLMDIEIQKGTGFDVLSLTRNVQYEVIFITGYREYAIEALRESAIDYILKPISLSQLKGAFDRYTKKKCVINSSIKNDSLFVDGVHVVRRIQLMDILYIEVLQNRCVFVLTDNRVFHSLHPISTFRNELPNYIIISHRKYYINLYQVENIHSKRGGYAVFANGQKIPISYRKKKDVMALLKQL